MQEPGQKAVVLMLEDYYMAKDPQSTEFIGWLYETDFEYLAGPSIVQIVVTGVRSEDMMLRLLLAGIDPVRIRDARRLHDLHGLHDRGGAGEGR